MNVLRRNAAYLLESAHFGYCGMHVVMRGRLARHKISDRLTSDRDRVTLPLTNSTQQFR